MCQPLSSMSSLGKAKGKSSDDDDSGKDNVIVLHRSMSEDDKGKSELYDISKPSVDPDDKGKDIDECQKRMTNLWTQETVGRLIRESELPIQIEEVEWTASDEELLGSLTKRKATFVKQEKNKGKGMDMVGDIDKEWLSKEHLWKMTMAQFVEMMTNKGKGKDMIGDIDKEYLSKEQLEKMTKDALFKMMKSQGIRPKPLRTKKDDLVEHIISELVIRTLR